MSTGDATALAGVALTGFVIVGGCVGWVIKNWLANQLAPIILRQNAIANDVAVVKREILPNGGTSLADRVVRIETKIDGQDRRR